MHSALSPLGIVSLTYCHRRPRPQPRLRRPVEEQDASARSSVCTRTCSELCGRAPHMPRLAAHLLDGKRASGLRAPAHAASRSSQRGRGRSVPIEATTEPETIVSDCEEVVSAPPYCTQQALNGSGGDGRVVPGAALHGTAWRQRRWRRRRGQRGPGTEANRGARLVCGRGGSAGVGRRCRGRAPAARRLLGLAAAARH